MAYIPDGSYRDSQLVINITRAILVEGMARDGAEAKFVDDGLVGHCVSEGRGDEREEMKDER